MAMNAPNAVSRDNASAERKGYEPSMEEILASIRRIIADDQVVSLARPPAESMPASAVTPSSSEPPAFAAQNPDSIPPAAAEELGGPEGWTDAPPPATPKPPVSEIQDAPPLRSAFDFVPGREFRAPLSPRPPAPDRRAFTREQSVLRASAELPPEQHESPRRLAPSVRPTARPPAVPEEAPLVSPATDAMVSQAFNTLIASRFLQSNDAMGEMVRDMLKPMLKAWLDDNLPILVERMVRAEIERVARGGR